MAEAREQARQKALAGIKAAGEAGDWRALEAFLRLSFHADYRRDASINVTATATNQQALVCDEATRQRLIELRAKIMGGKNDDATLPQGPVGLLGPVAEINDTSTQ